MPVAVAVLHVIKSGHLLKLKRAIAEMMQMRDRPQLVWNPLGDLTTFSQWISLTEPIPLQNVSNIAIDKGTPSQSNKLVPFNLNQNLKVHVFKSKSTISNKLVPFNLLNLDFEPRFNDIRTMFLLHLTKR